MMVARRLFHIAAMAATAALLSGCISLLPKSEPSQLYRFDAAAPPRRAALPDGQRVGVLKLNTSFSRTVSGDRILGITGSRAAFLAGSRWTGPASVLFDEAVARVFDGEDGVARLITRGEAGKASFVLRLEVRDFAAVYLSGPKAAPTVVVRMRAVLIRANDRSLAGEKMFEARVRAGENRVGAIVEAFNEAVGRNLTELVGWTDVVAAAG